MIPKIGQKMMLAPSGLGKNDVGRNKSTKAIPCTVIWVNEAHRFFRVRFDTPFGSFTESYKFV